MTSTIPRSSSCRKTAIPRATPRRLPRSRRRCSATDFFEIAPADTSFERDLAFAQNALRLDPTSQRGGAALADALRTAGERAGSLVLVVDQLEELFTLSPKATQARFAALLAPGIWE